MSAFDICVIVFVSAAVVAALGTLIYNKIKGKNSCGDCDGCCAHCSVCSNCNTQKSEEDKK